MIEGKYHLYITNNMVHGEFTKSTVQLLSLLAEKNTIVFVEYPFTIKDVVMSLLENKKSTSGTNARFKNRIKMK
jgi:hypothetical protein